MIISEIFYGLKCNRCGKIHDDGEHSFWNDESTAIENACESEWIEQNGKHYCPTCYDYNEDKDENIVRAEFPDHLKLLNKFLKKMVLGHNDEVKELDNCFLVSKSLHNKTRLDSFEEKYIKDMLGENLISIDYKKHERYSSFTLNIIIEKIAVIKRVKKL